MIPVIFGKKPVGTTVRTDKWICPKCKLRTTYKEKERRNYFHFYFIPLIPLGRERDYVKCAGCNRHFDPAILAGRSREDTQARWKRAITNVMVRVALVDGRVDDRQVSAIQRMFSKLFVGSTIKKSQVMSQVAAVEADADGDVNTDLAPFIPIMNEDGRKTVIKVMLAVAVADGKFHKGEEKLVGQVANTLHLDDYYLGEIAHIRRAQQVDEHRNPDKQEILIAEVIGEPEEVELEAWEAP